MEKALPSSSPNRPLSVDVEFSNVSYDVRVTGDRSFFQWGRKTEQKRILHQISGSVAGGESLAILGPSGSGKTTLLNLLAGRGNGALSEGQILFSRRRRTPRTRRLLGYVTQDDVFFSKLTVRETLLITARLRLSNSLTWEQKVKRVDELIKKLRLEKCQHTHVGDSQLDKGISGGERKRLNIANELIHQPNVFLADEYTSGLDSSSASTVTDMLIDLCQRNRMTLIATIHQPSSNIFRMFSRVLVLVSGHVAYFGTPGAVVDYFTSIGYPLPYQQYNPADFVLDIVVNDEYSTEDSTDTKSAPPNRIVGTWKNNEFSTESGLDSPIPFVALEMDASDGTSDSSQPDVEMRHKRRPNILINPAQGWAGRGENPILENKANQPPSSQLGRMKRALTKRGSELLSACHLIKNESGPQEFDAEKYASSWWDQVLTLAYRALRQKSGLLLDKLTVIQVIVVSVILSIFWWRTPAEESAIEDRLGFLSATGVYWGNFATSAAVFSFPKEKKVLSKDRSSGIYRLSAYYFAKSTVEIPADMCYPIFFAVVSYFSTGINPDVRAFFLYVLIIILNVSVATSIGLFVSSVMMNASQAQVICSAWTLISLVTSGYILDPDNIPGFLKFTRYLSFMRYSYDGLVQVEWGFGRDYSCTEGTPTVYSMNGTKCPIDLQTLLKTAQLTTALPLWGCILVQLAWIVILRVLAYFALKLLHTSHKPPLASWRLPNV